MQSLDLCLHSFKKQIFNEHYFAFYRFVDRPDELREAKPPQPQPPQRAAIPPWIKSKMKQHWASETFGVRNTAAPSEA